MKDHRAGQGAAPDLLKGHENPRTPTWQGQPSCRNRSGACAGSGLPGEPSCVRQASTTPEAGRQHSLGWGLPHGYTRSLSDLHMGGDTSPSPTPAHPIVHQELPASQLLWAHSPQPGIHSPGSEQGWSRGRSAALCCHTPSGNGRVSRGDGSSHGQGAPIIPWSLSSGTCAPAGTLRGTPASRRARTGWEASGVPAPTLGLSGPSEASAPLGTTEPLQHTS